MEKVGTCSIYERDEKYIQSFGRKSGRKTLAWMGGEYYSGS
jgi:hypothetical protein